MAVQRLELTVQRRRLAIGDVPLGLVDYGGQFIVVTLDNVPQYIPDEQVRATVYISGADLGLYKGDLPFLPYPLGLRLPLFLCYRPPSSLLFPVLSTPKSSYEIWVLFKLPQSLQQKCISVKRVLVYFKAESVVHLIRSLA